MRLIRGGKWMNSDDMTHEIAEYLDQDDEIVEKRHAAIDKWAHEVSRLRTIAEQRERDCLKREESLRRWEVRRRAERDRNQGRAAAS